MNIREFIKNRIALLDGALGTQLQSKGLRPGELPERWNITHSDIVRDIHLSYLNAGSDVISTNTFGANILKFTKEELDEIVSAAIKNAKDAISLHGGTDKFVALDIGPCGKLLKPFGDLDFEDAVNVFKETAILGEKYGADLVIIETMNDLYETKAAVLAVKESTSLPIFVSNVYSENGKLMTGAGVNETVSMLEGLSVDAIGANCSLGPRELSGIVSKMLDISSTPTIFMPNAGLPRIVDGKTVFDVDENEFADVARELVSKGVRIVGGCCGTTPEYIRTLKNAISSLTPQEITKKETTTVSSGTNTVVIGKEPIVIGERINPTGKKRFKQALIENDIAYILEEGIKQQSKGAHILDVNVGIPDIDEVRVITDVVTELQAVVDLPLQIDTSNVAAMESALRRYNGKALINSVNGKQESMNAIFPIVKKYGGAVVCLTLDENGIPDSAEERYNIACKILDRAKEYGLSKNDLIFDTLCMSISTNKDAAEVTVGALKLISERLGAKTVLGVSNVSYGLPDREAVNAKFLSFALKEGLSCAIINPFSAPVMEAFYGYVREGGNESLTDFAERVINASYVEAEETDGSLRGFILHGQKVSAANACTQMLENADPLSIVNTEIIPALDEVGKLYEDGKVYLPQLLMSAESAKACFEVIKSAMSASNEKVKKCKFVIATVHGDIHDIGKNIVKLLLDNYGFEVIDLGKDVSPEKVLEAIIEHHAPLCGLSALMTTTVPAMEETVKLIKEKAPWCRVVVGGAVLTREYADKMGADKYCPDALSAVRYAEEVFATL